MNKTMGAYLLLIFLSSASVMKINGKEPLMFRLESNQAQDVHDMHDFFDVDDDKPREVQRVSKEPQSRAKIVLIQLGIKVALALEATCNKLKTFWLWLTSWIGYGSDKA